MRFLVIIPAFNEGKNLPRVAEDLGDIVPRALVVNDGSSDDSEAVAVRSGFSVVSHPYNVGIGGAVQTGLKYALRNGFDVAVQFDGDCQHRADQLEALLRPVLSGDADLVVGSRILAASQPPSFLRSLGGKFFSFLLRVMSGCRVTDPTSGFRCYGRKAIERFADRYPEDYPEVESILLGAQLGLRIREVPALMRQRGAGRSSINAFSAMYYMIKVSLGLVIGKMRSVT